MRISKLILRNFRRHNHVTIPFEIDTTILIGENDAGKTSIIDAIKIVFSDLSPVFDDFGNLNENLEISVELDTSRGFSLIAQIEEDKVIISKYATYSGKYIADLRKRLNDIEDEQIKILARQFGLIVGNSKAETLRGKLLEIMSDRENFKDGRFFIKVSKFGESVKVYYLDGKSFDDVNKFVHETFFKDMQKSIWSERISENVDMSLEQYIEDKVQGIKSKIENDIQEHDIINKLRSYISDISDIKLQVNFEKKDIALNVRVQFVSSGFERDAKRFGDGTRRRVTFALLQHKIETETEEALYILDEPDTHLHPRAQSDLLDIIEGIAANGNQILISTHSPFIMNSAYMRQVRLLEKDAGVTKIKRLSDEKARSSSMKSLGIENSHLFFSRKIVIIEGRTELFFFPHAYEKMYNRPLSRDFIRLMPREGIQDATRFAEVVQDFMSHSDIFLVTDNDASDEVKEIAKGLNIPEANQYKLGIKEFEDLFGSRTIWSSWQQYVLSKGKALGPDWDDERIFELAQESIGKEGKYKFSERLSELNKGAGVGLSKPLLGEALGLYCDIHALPTRVREFLEHLGRDAR